MGKATPIPKLAAVRTLLNSTVFSALQRVGAGIVSKIVEPNIDNRRNADALGVLGITITLIIVGAGAWSLDGALAVPR